MNNFNFLNIVNPQISYAIDSGIERCDNTYMVCIPAVIGYDRNIACSLFLAITEKLLSGSLNDALERMFNDILNDPGVLLDGYDDFKLGEDYFLSESLYDWLMFTYPEPEPDPAEVINVRPDSLAFLNKNVGNTYSEKVTVTNNYNHAITPIINTDDLHEYISVTNNKLIRPGHGNDIIIKYHPQSGGVHNSSFDIIVGNDVKTINIVANAVDTFNEFKWPDGYVILHGVDVNMLLNLTKYNKYIVGEILTEEYLDNLHEIYSSKKCPRNLRPTLSKPDLTEEPEESSEEDNTPDFVMKDYIVFNPDLTCKQDTDCYKWLFDINIKDMRNLEWFYLKNRYVSSESFTDDEICNLPSTFFKIIYKYATVQNAETIKNQIYDLVSKYFMNGQTDEMYRGLNLLLSTMVSSSNNNSLTCGCSSDMSATNLNGDNMQSCADLYKTSMLEWLKNMFADAEYYKDWFFTVNTGMCPTPNEPMIDLLIKLLEDYLNLNYDSYVKIGNNKMYLHDHFCCDTTNVNSGVRTAIENYIKLLNIVKNNEIDGNINKIKVWGTAFAEVFPYLSC